MLGDTKITNSDQNSIMSACFSCSLIRSSPLIQDPYLSWPLAKLVRPISSLRLRKYSNASPRTVVRAVEQGLGVVSPDDVSLLQDPPLIDVDTIEKVNEEVHGVIDGVADTKSEDKALTPSTRVKKKKEVEDSSESRFKLRNGREVGLFFSFYCLILRSSLVTEKIQKINLRSCLCWFCFENNHILGKVQLGEKLGVRNCDIRLVNWDKFPRFDWFS